MVVFTSRSNRILSRFRAWVSFVGRYFPGMARDEIKVLEKRLNHPLYSLSDESTQEHIHAIKVLKKIQYLDGSGNEF